MKEQFFGKLETLIAEARRLKTRGFDEQEPEEATKQYLIGPLFLALGLPKSLGHRRWHFQFTFSPPRKLLAQQMRSLCNSWCIRG
jgi:hypothetical protein